MEGRWTKCIELNDNHAEKWNKQVEIFSRTGIHHTALARRASKNLTPQNYGTLCCLIEVIHRLVVLTNAYLDNSFKNCHLIKSNPGDSIEYLMTFSTSTRSINQNQNKTIKTHTYSLIISIFKDQNDVLPKYLLIFRYFWIIS